MFICLDKRNSGKELLLLKISDQKHLFNMFICLGEPVEITRTSLVISKLDFVTSSHVDQTGFELTV